MYFRFPEINAIDSSDELNQRVTRVLDLSAFWYFVQKVLSCWLARWQVGNPSGLLVQSSRECTPSDLSTGISNLLQPAQAEVMLGQPSKYLASWNWTNNTSFWRRHQLSGLNTWINILSAGTSWFLWAKYCCRLWLQLARSWVPINEPNTVAVWSCMRRDYCYCEL
jgi:hypothetical protein